MGLSMATGRMWVWDRNPLATDDSAAGYEIGNWWMNSTTYDLYQCLLATPDNAVWERKVGQESGSFLPVLQFGGNSTGITYSTQAANYLKQANCVFFTINMILTNKGSSTGTARIIGLPIQSGNLIQSLSVVSDDINLSDNYSSLVGAINAGSQVIILRQIGKNQQFANMTDDLFSNTSKLLITGFYFI